MRTIHIKSKIGNGFGEPVAEFLRLVKIINEYKEEQIVIDFKQCVFFQPFLLLMLFTLKKHLTIKGFNISFSTANINANIAAYLHAISFSNGFNVKDFPPEEYEQIINKYESKTYIPLISFPSGKIQSDTKLRERFLNVLGTMLRRQVNAQGQMHTAITYLLDEAINNITDHANTDSGYILAQYYPQLRYMDICIADLGISILGSYLKIGKGNPANHEEALKLALEGVSTKDVSGRGFGIRTSRNMLVNGLGGSYMLLSGNALLIHNSEREQITLLPNEIELAGTTVYMRIPTVAKQNFNYTAYLEN